MQQRQTKENRDKRIQDYKDRLQTYLDQPQHYTKIQDMIVEKKTRFPIDLDRMRQEFKGEHSKLVEEVIRNPTEYIKVLQTTLNRIAQDFLKQQDDKKTAVDTKFTIYFQGKLGRNFVTPRGLGAQQVNQLVGIQGIVTKMSLVQLKITKSVHYNEKKNDYKIMEYSNNMDPAEFTNLRQANQIPRKDEEGNPLIMEFGLSQMRNFQTLVVQEVPERTPTGMLPRSLEIIVDQEMVDLAKPGDRVSVIGVYKCFANSGSFNYGSFRTALIALDIKQMDKENEVKISQEDVKNIKQIAQKKNLLEYVAKSIAPSIYGHDRIKQAILLLLLGGTEKNLNTGTHLRGDINILMIGDPSTAKSQMLRYIMGVAPLAINTTGRGTSSVGLTAAVKRDPDTGENTLEAGAMVLADGGVILIDEFDKMNEIDRVAIHEVMEQQTVTIAKAGIHCQLNARCSVVAAANPIYGEYQIDLPPTQNIGLPDSLLSRFDLLFVIQDGKNSEMDRLIAQRVTKNHRFVGQNQEEQYLGDIIQQINNQRQDNSQFIQYSKLLHTPDQRETLSQTFLKKYIIYAKEKHAETVLNDQALQEITRQWTQLRQDQVNNERTIKTQPITIRTLESMIRLASAHAKLRLSSIINLQDVREAVKLIKLSLSISDIEDDYEEYVQEEEPVQQRFKTPSKRKAYKIEEKDENKIEDIVAWPTSEKKKIEQEQQDDNDAKFHLEIQLATSAMVNQEQKKLVWRVITDLAERSNHQEIHIDLVWGTLSSIQQRPIITSYRVFLKCLMELDGKIYFDQQSRTVQLI